HRVRLNRAQAVDRIGTAARNASHDTSQSTSGGIGHAARGFIHLDEIDQATAVCALILEGKVQYIGLSTGVRRPGGEHRSEPRIAFDEVQARPCAWRASCMSWNVKLIHLHRPPLNIRV